MITIIGNHKVQCGSLMDGIDNLMSGEMADIIYSDPPWGEGNLKYWETLRMKMTGDSKRRDNPLEPFLNKFFEVCQKYAKNIVFVEYGVAWDEYLVGIASKYGLNRLGRATVLYDAGSKQYPCHVHIFSKSPIQLPEDLIRKIESCSDDDMNAVNEAIKPFVKEGGIILDPCCGMGYSAQAAIDNNMFFRGNELNKKRIEKTIYRLENPKIGRK